MGREEVKPELYPAPSDPLAPLRAAVESATRNLGLTADLSALSPEHWQRVLVAVEARMHLRGIEAPDGWREALAAQIGRSGADHYTGPES